MTMLKCELMGSLVLAVLRCRPVTAAVRSPQRSRLDKPCPVSSLDCCRDCNLQVLLYDLANKWFQASGGSALLRQHCHELGVELWPAAGDDSGKALLQWQVQQELRHRLGVMGQGPWR